MNKNNFVLNPNKKDIDVLCNLVFEIEANRFLRNMVRAIVGTMIDVGKEKISIEDFIKIIESKKRSNAGASVPGKGLFLTKVVYK